MHNERTASPIVLTLMTAERSAEFAEMLEEFRAAGEYHVYDGNFAIAWQGYAGFYELLSRMKAGGYPRPDIVPMDSYFIESRGMILGEVYIRHRVNPTLWQIGGHVGYKVRPSARNRGVATAALRLALGELAVLGVDRALVTCNTNNAASAKVIERCGGRRIDDALIGDRIERRYWLPTGVIPAH